MRQPANASGGPTGEISPDDLELLRDAVRLLEVDTFSEAAMTAVGRLVGGGVSALSRLTPEEFRRAGATALAAVLERAFLAVVRSLDAGARPGGPRWLDRALSSTWIDATAAVLAGAAGGAGGIATTALELPLTTTLLMRTIAQIARREGEDLRTQDARLECLKVFALGGRITADAADAGYYAVRLAVAESVPRLAERTLQEVFPKLLARVAERFSVPVSTKLGAQAAPGLGAAAGALINLAFVSHFERKALGHFRVRRLERRYGVETVRAAYDALRLHLG